MLRDEEFPCPYYILMSEFGSFLIRDFCIYQDQVQEDHNPFDRKVSRYATQIPTRPWVRSKERHVEFEGISHEAACTTRLELDHRRKTVSTLASGSLAAIEHCSAEATLVRQTKPINTGSKLTMRARTAWSRLRSIHRAQVAIHLFPSTVAWGRSLSVRNSLSTGPSSPS